MTGSRYHVTVTPEEPTVDFRIVEGDEEETDFELVDDPPGVDLLPVDEQWELVPTE